MGNRSWRAAVCLVALTALTACGKQGCTNVALDSAIQVQVPSAIQQLVRTFRVELCQSGQCKAVEFSRDGKRANGSALPGVTVSDDAYEVSLNVLGAGWKAGTSSRLTVSGLRKNGKEILSHTDTFEFDTSYPNGKDCDGSPELRYSTSVGASDITT